MRPGRQRAREQRDAFVDRRPIPSAAVLVGQRDELAVGGGARGAARVGEQHQREEARHLAVVGKNVVDRAREADRFARQVGACAASGPDVVV